VSTVSFFSSTRGPSRERRTGLLAEPALDPDDVQAVVPHMRQKGLGVIVHVASRPGVEPTAGFAAYGVTKAALVRPVRTLDVELRPHSIRVNAIAPSSSPLKRTSRSFRPEALTGAVEPEAMAEVIAFLVSDKAGPVSGAIVPAYGG
jgi:NAD(P)-dependent dehydrogenase (short-subunit alcohol dehydrogenase family)